MAEKNLMKLAKSNKKPVPPMKKTVEKKEQKKEVTLSPAEERDLKAKQKVQELLKDVDLTPDKKEEVFELESEEQPKQGVEWLEEQLSLLSEKNESLKAELELSKADYAKIFAENQRFKHGNVSNDGDFVKVKVIELFNEIQTNHIQLGTDPRTGIGNFRIYCPGFLNRMITFFPFLAEYKRY